MRVTELRSRPPGEQGLKRCQATVKPETSGCSSRMAPWRREKYGDVPKSVQCRRVAAVDMDGILHCRMHAGMAALGILLEVTNRKPRTSGERRHLWGFCLDCLSEDPAEYMVYDRLWKEAGMTPDGGRLCPTCLEKRLGRALTLQDFPSYVPLNRALYLGHGLRAGA